MQKYTNGAVEKIEHLRKIIKKEEYFEEAKKLIIEINAMGHFSKKHSDNTLLDTLWLGLKEEDFLKTRKPKDATIFWNIWHITRIEDTVISLFIARDSQVLDSKWNKKLNTETLDNGIIMNFDEIQKLSGEVVKREFVKYNIKVKEKIESVIKKLKFEDLKNKVLKEDLAKVLDEGAVPKDDSASRLIDFWGKKNVAGLILMPITRHLFFHIEDAFKIKEKIK